MQDYLKTKRDVMGMIDKKEAAKCLKEDEWYN
jgi:hypothetical protein